MLGKEILEIINLIEFGDYKFKGLFFLNETPTVWSKRTFVISNLSLREASDSGRHWITIVSTSKRNE